MSSESLSLSTHILDMVLGRPAGGITVKLFKSENEQWIESHAVGVTDADGRFKNFQKIGEVCGTYKIVFNTSEYFERLGREIFYPSVEVIFNISSATQHYHIPLLLSTFGYSTYRGS